MATSGLCLTASFCDSKAPAKKDFDLIVIGGGKLRERIHTFFPASFFYAPQEVGV